MVEIAWHLVHVDDGASHHQEPYEGRCALVMSTHTLSLGKQPLKPFSHKGP